MTEAGLEALLREAVPFALPMRRRFRGTDVREGVLLRGPSGWGEFAPFDDYSDAAAALWLCSAVEAAFGTWPEPVRDTVPVNAIIPAVPADIAAAMTRAAVLDHGCTTIKVKVAEPGESALDDEGRVAAVRDALTSTLGSAAGAIRIDANGAWTPEQAIRVLRRLQAYGLEYVEQPCSGLADLVEVRKAVDVPIAADESIRRDGDVVDLRGQVDVAIVKVGPLGGVGRALEVAEQVGVDVVVSGSLDSAVGLSAGIALAAVLPERAAGLGTGALLEADVVDSPLVPTRGVLPVVRTAPDLESLVAARNRLRDGRAAWWAERLTAAWKAGARDRVGHLVA